jgi:integrase
MVRSRKANLLYWYPGRSSPALPIFERVLSLLIAATGLRISEGLGLKWGDVDYERKRIWIRRTWNPRFGEQPTKTRRSKAPVPMHPILADVIRGWQAETPYSKPTDWIFPSLKLKGKRPRTANMLVEDYLRPAALKVGVERIENPSVRFGFQNLRHGLSTFLVANNIDPKVVQGLLRHSRIETTLNLYTRNVGEKQIAAQGVILNAILQPSSEAVN